MEFPTENPNIQVVDIELILLLFLESETKCNYLLNFGDNLAQKILELI